MLALLETTTISDILDRKPNTVARVGALSSSDTIAASSISYGEIWFGLEIMPHGRRRREYEQEALEVFSGLDLEPVTEVVALAYVQIKADLHRRGLMIPEADLWIAATAQAKGYTLVTRDAHFARISTLTIEDWSKP